MPLHVSSTVVLCSLCTVIQGILCCAVHVQLHKEYCALQSVYSYTRNTVLCSPCTVTQGIMCCAVCVQLHKEYCAVQSVYSYTRNNVRCSPCTVTQGIMCCAVCVQLHKEYCAVLSVYSCTSSLPAKSGLSAHTVWETDFHHYWDGDKIEWLNRP